MCSSFFHFEGARSYLMDQMGPKRPKCSSVWNKWVWLLQIGGTVWNEVATSQDTSGPMNWNHFTEQKWPLGGAIGPLNGKKGQNGPFCGHNHMRWCGFEIAECVNHFVAFFSPENRRVPSRSNFAPCCGTRSGCPRLPTARILHLWPFCPKTVRGL